MRRPGILIGDQSVYAGARLLGHVRSTVSGVTAFRTDGAVLGSYPSHKEAMGAIGALSSSNGSRSEPAA